MDLEEVIRKALKRGKLFSQIKEELIERGWDKAIVDKTIKEILKKSSVKELLQPSAFISEGKQRKIMGMNVSTVFIAISILVVAGLIYFFVFSGLPITGSIIQNPEFNYPQRGWLPGAIDDQRKLSTLPTITATDWLGNGVYENGTIDGRSGIMILHPINTEEGRYIEQEVTLPKGKNYLNVSIADIAGKITVRGESTATDCSDVGFLIKVVDKETNKEDIISDIIVNADDGWKDLSYDISGYKGKNVIIRVESYAGGPCGDWKGEWAAVDYVNIVASG